MNLTGCQQGGEGQETTTPTETTTIGDGETTTSFQEESSTQTNLGASPCVKYSYKDHALDQWVTTKNGEEFASHVAESDPIDVVFQLSYEEGQAQTVEEFNLAFLQRNGIDLESEFYTLYAATQSPFIILNFEGYADYAMVEEILLSATWDEALTGVSIEVPHPNVNC
ncbi:MAG: hypothetical protein IJY42_05705 [Clostridia bacterium]|nr:hypothetical protein [Clostridia bacterium]